MSVVQETYQKQAEKLIPRFQRRNMEAFYCENAQAARELVLSMIPEGSTVTSGGSATLEETGIDPYFYTARERADDELFPWDFIDAGVTKKFLLKEWKKSKECETTPNCREKCSGCGAATFGCGVCFDKR